MSDDLLVIQARALFRALRRSKQPRWLVDADVTENAASEIGRRFDDAGRRDEWSNIVAEWIRECNGHVPADCELCGARFITNWPLVRFDTSDDAPLSQRRCWRCVYDSFDGEDVPAEPNTTGEIDARCEGGCWRSGCMWRAFFYERVLDENLLDQVTLRALEDRYDAEGHVRQLDCKDCGQAFVWMYDYAEEPPIAYIFERDRLNTTHCAECARERAHAEYDTDAFIAHDIHTMTRAGLRRLGIDVPDPAVSPAFGTFLDEHFGDFWRCDFE